mmetsp:Transcript_7208/g.29907  ORF Transcript_7208/g.29907 Transcript_7208/m.29907 type:complete len:111 (-) Transcript_7208:18-350(-)
MLDARRGPPTRAADLVWGTVRGTRRKKRTTTERRLGHRDAPAPFVSQTFRGKLRIRSRRGLDAPIAVLLLPVKFGLKTDFAFSVRDARVGKARALASAFPKARADASLRV